MQKAALIFFTALFLIGNTEFHELLKAPVLVLHYFEHKAETPGLTPAQFLALHYSQQNHTDSDNYDDSQLPFKATEHMPATHIKLFISYYTIKVPVLNPTVTANEPVYEASFVSQSLLCNIWQPPKC